MLFSFYFFILNNRDYTYRKNETEDMFKKITSLFIICCLCIFVTACGPSEEKVAQAQQKYAQLAEIHNQVVEAHNDVDNNSLDEALTELREKITEVEGYNLVEMDDEEIDILIQIMDALISSYERHLNTLTNMKGEEEAAVLVPIPVTLVNQTEISFTEIKLYESGDVGVHENLLFGINEFAQGETLTGLTLQRDVDNTPRILELVDVEGTVYQLELLAGEYTQEGIKLNLIYDAEQKIISLTT